MNWMEQIVFASKEVLHTLLPSDLVEYEILPFLRYSPLDFYHLSIDRTPCLYQSFNDDVYEKISTPLTTLDDLNTLAKDLDRRVLIREGYLDPDDPDGFDYSLTDAGNICGHFRFEVGYLIRLIPRYKSVTPAHFEPHSDPASSYAARITLSYPEHMSFEDYYDQTLYPTYRKAYEEIQEYNDQVIECTTGTQSSIFHLSVKCLSHLVFRPSLNGLLYMMVNDPKHVHLVQKEGIELIFQDD